MLRKSLVYHDIAFSCSSCATFKPVIISSICNEPCTIIFSMKLAGVGLHMAMRTELSA